MYTPTSSRAANAYRQVGVQSTVESASPHQLIRMLFDGLLQNLNAARGAMQRSELEAKGRHLNHAVIILGEGLKSSLDRVNGGEVAQSLNVLYDYCLQRLTLANLRNDAQMVQEVVELLEPIAQSWNDISASPAVAARG